MPAAIAAGMGIDDEADGEALLQALHRLAASMQALADEPATASASTTAG
ncbi:hypothetical protein OVA14_13160 [Agrococcus sp. SL85]|nr:hypothetical protein [Agrococcus sp. SL85]WAC66202.1 hypothetical protein OVA14_13160 [Agrococcus sp. SL85]